MIPMQKDLDNLTFLVGDNQILSGMQNAPVLPMFSEDAVSFLSDLSRQLLKNPRTRAFVDVSSYAYWIRKASLESVKEKHRDYRNRLGRGIAFHVAPSNVPVNFAVSMTSSLLAGNLTVIRVSDKQFEQVNIICDAINQLIDSTHKGFGKHLCIVRYSHCDEITAKLSSICDLRIIWGGDRTIEAIRKAPLPPRAIEMAFADRHSIAVIDSDKYLQCDPEEIAKGFYTDTYYTDQNACSSPRLVMWLGNSVEKARDLFWSHLHKLVLRDYDMKPIQAVDKFASACILGMKQNGQRIVSSDNYVVRVEVDRLIPDLMDYKSGGGYFFEYVASNLEEVVPLLTKKCQTISVLGVEKEDVRRVVFKNGVRGVDRIVPLGQTMGLEFIWDGYKMIENMTRFVYTGVYN